MSRLGPQTTGRDRGKPGVQNVRESSARLPGGELCAETPGLGGGGPARLKGPRMLGLEPMLIRAVPPRAALGQLPGLPGSRLRKGART